MSEEQTPYKILVIDDEPLNLKVLSELLRAEYRAVVAKSGEQGLQAAAAHPTPDLILLDIVMPGMDGFETLSRLKADPVLATIPVIIVTSQNDVASETRGFSLGAVDFITKPFNAPVVMARVRTHLALQQQRRDLESLNAVKNRFLGIAAHDLRNPLSVVRGLAEALLEPRLEEDERLRMVEAVRRVSDQMLELLNDLLDVSAIESGNFDLDLELADLTELAGERVGLLAMQGVKKQVELVMGPSDTALCQIDPGRIAQVLDNLLSNAIKFSPPDTTVTVLVEAEGPWATCTVRDQGPGIAEEDLPKLFGEFQRLSSQPTGGERSTGLGLSIAKRIVSAHKGNIWVDSAVGIGSAFRFQLPLASAATTL
ncbi:hybrid sensor histidine kinase/response regulator [Magnetofaba australis]|uniref:histidine kinase n=1 Tax=Magnetofaba australis IT-1 TaxID=1434232 RepID=A0A1Y2K1R2_9PROT|nr:hybrid sensor histidine kinase/response regulator [Magnetofaba australis]OSM00132.1 putative response regulator receiver sensor signal transduction histidine kinase [Magnetofaba australis IT-1]